MQRLFVVVLFLLLFIAGGYLSSPLFASDSNHLSNAPLESDRAETSLKASQAIASENGQIPGSGVVKNRIILQREEPAEIGTWNSFILHIIITSTSLISRRTPWERQSRDCFANQKVALGAVKAYNAYQDIPLRNFDENTEQTLIKAKYLRRNLDHPNINCQLLSFGDLNDGGIIACTLHLDWAGNLEKADGLTRHRVYDQDSNTYYTEKIAFEAEAPAPRVKVWNNYLVHIARIMPYLLNILIVVFVLFKAGKLIKRALT